MGKERVPVGLVEEAGISNRKPVGNDDWVRTGTIAQAQTTDATVTIVHRQRIADDTVSHFSIRGTAHEVATGDSHANNIRGAVENIAGTTAIVGTPDEDVHEDAGASAWAIAAAVSGNELRVTVTGEAAHTIDWTVRLELT